MDFLIIGAGLSGAVLARRLAEAGHRCDIFEKEGYVAGHCHSSRDAETGIMVHRFGPHTLHTDNEEIWSFLERFVEIYPYTHRKQAWAAGRLYPFPINLQAINLFFQRRMSSDEAGDYIAQQVVRLDEPPQNFEEAALASVGPGLYHAFYKGYTRKQWGREPTELPAFIFRRLPVHLTDDRNVFHHKKQGQPVGGYTNMVERMLDHPLIRVFLNRRFTPETDRQGYDHLFYSGPIDEYFDWRLGRLAYRSLSFETERRFENFQECGTVNYCDEDVPYTRIAEHKHFWPFERHEGTIISYEFSHECGPGDTPFYPVKLMDSKRLYEDYVALARSEPHVSFIGRLGTYRYLDMDVAIGEAMKAAEVALGAIADSSIIPSFFIDTGRGNY